MHVRRERMEEMGNSEHALPTVGREGRTALEVCQCRVAPERIGHGACTLDADVVVFKAVHVRNEGMKERRINLRCAEQARKNKGKKCTLMS